MCDRTHHISLSRVLPWSNENVVPGQQHQENQRDHIELKIPHHHNEKLQKEETDERKEHHSEDAFIKHINNHSFDRIRNKFFKNIWKEQKDPHLWFSVPYIYINFISWHLNLFFIIYLQNTWQPAIHNSNTMIIFYSLSSVSTDDAQSISVWKQWMSQSSATVSCSPL